MHLAVTGGTGFVGRFIAAAALRAGNRVTILGRRAAAGLPGPAGFQPWHLGEAPELAGVDAVVHAAFAHLPGRYRGGEGEDPAAFLRANRDGSLRLFDAAKAAGVRTLVNLSSRAVFDGYPQGALLTEDLPPRPTSLYGEIKAELEAALAGATSAAFCGISLRATGVFGMPAAGQPNKWTPLVAELLAGRPIPSRVATEVHGDDLATAVLLLLDTARRPGGGRSAAEGNAAVGDTAAGPGPVVHASDIVLDRRDLALAVARRLGRSGIPLPPRSDPGRVSILDCATLRRLGWQPRGWAALEAVVSEMVANAGGEPALPGA